MRSLNRGAEILKARFYENALAARRAKRIRGS